MDADQLFQLISCVRRIFLAALIAIDVHKLFLDYVCKLPLTKFDLLQHNYKVYLSTVSNFENNFLPIENQYELYQLFLHYHDELKVIVKVNMLCEPSVST